MEPRPWVLAECTWDELRTTGFEVAVLPWGATEAHNRHLPYGTDTFESEAIAIESARLAWLQGARVGVLPAIPFGVNTGQRDVPFCLNMMPSTQTAVVRDLIPPLVDHGVRKLVILNGHGGNDFKPLIRELQPATSLVLVLVNWYHVQPAAKHFDLPGDHAGELETSLMMHVRPELVRPLETAGDGRERLHRIQAFREGWAWMPRRWTQVSADTGVGDPAAATAAKGERYYEAVTARVAGLLRDLDAADPADLYER